MTKLGASGGFGEKERNAWRCLPGVHHVSVENPECVGQVCIFAGIGDEATEKLIDSFNYSFPLPRIRFQRERVEFCIISQFDKGETHWGVSPMSTNWSAPISLNQLIASSGETIPPFSATPIRSISFCKSCARIRAHRIATSRYSWNPASFRYGAWILIVLVFALGDVYLVHH
jgi:hypothetical protein